MAWSAPVLWCALALLGGTAALQMQAELPTQASLILIGGMGLLGFVVPIAWIGAVGRRGPIALAVTVLASAALGWSWAAWRAQEALEHRLPRSLEGVDLELLGVVRGLPQPGELGLRFEFDVNSCRPACPDLKRVSLSASKRLSNGLADLRAGEVWTLNARLRRPHAIHNPGGFDREQRWLQEGIDGVGTVRRFIEHHAQGERSLLIFLERWRAILRDTMAQAMGPWQDRRWSASQGGSEGTLLALSVGDQAAIHPSHWTVFNRTGVGHLMSISGLHITALAGMAGLLAGRLWRSRFASRWGGPLWISVPQVRWTVAMGVGLFYAALAGWGIPAQRTAFMLTAAALCNLSGRAQGMSTVLACALVVVLLCDPWAALTPGFWLSFGAVSALVWAGQGTPRIQSAPGWWVFLGTAARTQWAATLAMVPLGVLFFGNVSLIGPLANAFAIPLVSLLITPAALCGAALSALHPDWGGWILGPSLWVTDLLLWALGELSALEGAVWTLPRPPLVLVVLAGSGLVLMLAPRGVPVRAAGMLAILPLLLVPADRPAEGEWRITALDVGQGTAVVVQGADYTLLYDTGPASPSGTDAGARIVLPWMQQAGLNRIDRLIVSHLDLDHSGGLHSLLSGLQVDSVMASFEPEALGGQTHLNQGIKLPGHERRSRGMPRAVLAEEPPATDFDPAAIPPWQRCVRGTTWTHGQVQFRILHPRLPAEPMRGSSTNAVSCVMQIVGPGWRVLLTGDIEAAQERRLLEVFSPDELRADILMVPHHGSKTSSTEAFLDAVQPRHAIVQAAYRSRYGHPHPRVLERYAARGIQVWRSDAHGAITITLTAAQAPGVSASRQSPARYWRVDATWNAAQVSRRFRPSEHSVPSSLGSPAPVHGPGHAAHLISGGGAQEDREVAELFGRDEFP
jgi:competence protein ComEC